MHFSKEKRLILDPLETDNRVERMQFSSSGSGESLWGIEVQPRDRHLRTRRVDRGSQCDLL